VLYSVFSALIGTQSVLFSKTLAVLLRSTFSGDNQVGRGEGGPSALPRLGGRAVLTMHRPPLQLGKWFTWLVLLAFLTTAIFWVTRLNKVCVDVERPAPSIVPALSWLA
jgi:hypothetical protein